MNERKRQQWQQHALPRNGGGSVETTDGGDVETTCEQEGDVVKTGDSGDVQANAAAT